MLFTKMGTSVCLLALLSCCLALPADIVPGIPDEIDLSKLKPGNIYLEPIQGANEVPGGRIIGGAEVVPNSVPYQVAVINSRWELCGGSLISITRVLTAAHCLVDASFVQLRLGAHGFNSDEPTQVRLSSTKLIIHPKYDIGGFAANDIAVILLPSAVPPSNAIGTVPLAPANSGNFAGSSAFLSGWGITSDGSNAVSPFLRGINLNVITNAVCAFSYGDHILSSSLCTSGAGGVGSCNGDSGGPLVSDGVQIGVVSFGTQRCDLGHPSVFARISSFRNWIAENSGV